MKTIQELYNEVMADKDLKAALIGAAKEGKLMAFLKEHGCGATVQEAAAFLQEKTNEDVPLSFDELKNAAGGGCVKPTEFEIAPSLFGDIHTCALKDLVSVVPATQEPYHVDRQSPDDGALCNQTGR